MSLRVDDKNKIIEKDTLSIEPLPNKMSEVIEANQNKIEGNISKAKLDHSDGENEDFSLPIILNGMENIRERVMFDDNSDINEILFENIQNLANIKEPWMFENIKLELVNTSLKLSKLENIDTIKTLEKENHNLRLLRKSENPHDVSFTK